MAQRFVALLRGINVGRAKRVAMADLRALVEELGYSDVSTLLNSGNVVFTAPETDGGDAGAAGAAARIQAGIAERLGVSARVVGLTGEELTAAVAENPLLDLADNPSRLLVAILNDPGDRGKLEPLLEQDWSPEALAIGTRVAYLWCPEGVLKSRLPEAVERALGDSVTSRNWTTMKKIHDRL